jgi:hypothetical protein
LLHAQTDGQTDRQTDMTKLIVTFHNFVDAHKKFLIVLMVTVYSVRPTISYAQRDICRKMTKF